MQVRKGPNTGNRANYNDCTKDHDVILIAKIMLTGLENE